MDNIDTMGMQPAGELSAGGFGFDIWGLLNRRKWIILAGLVLGLIGGGVYYMVARPVFETVAQIIVATQAAAMASDRYAVKSPGELENLTRDALSTEMLRFQSVEVILRAIAKGELENLKCFEGEASVPRAIMESLSVTRGGEGMTVDANVINVAVEANNPADAMTVCRSLIDAYQETISANVNSNLDRVLKLIRQASDELGNQLRQKEAEYREYRLRTPTQLLGTAKSGLTAFQQRLFDFSQAMTEAELRQIELESQLKYVEKAATEVDDPAVLEAIVQRMSGIADNRSLDIREAKQKLFQLQANKTSLMTRYGDKHPNVLQAQKEIDDYRQMFASTLGAQFLRDERPAEETEKEKQNPSDNSSVKSFIESLKSELERLMDKRQVVSKQMGVESEQAKKVTDFQIGEEQLRDEILRIKELYVAVVKQLDEVRLLRGTGGMVMQVITQPTLPKQVAPNLPVSIMAGGVIGFMLFFGLAYAIDWSDKSFRSPDEIRATLGLPVIGQVPIIINDFAEDGETADADVVEGGQPAPILASYHLPHSSYAEAYRNVRTALYFSTGGQRHKLIQITSPTRGDGKSTLSANLALSIAQSGKRVLLVDADMRRPKLHELFALKNDVGLSSVIAHEIDLPDAVQPTVMENLTLLSSGPKPGNPAELLTSSRFKDLLEALKEAYDFVIIDTPPVLAVTDASVVAALADGVIMALQITRSCKPNSEFAAERLHAIGARLLGVVVNGVGWKRSLAYRYSGTFGSESRFFRTSLDMVNQDGSGYAYGEQETHAAGNGVGRIPLEEPTSTAP